MVEKSMELYYRLQWFLLRTFSRSYFRFSIRGCEHIPSTGPIILAANHCSYLDPPLIGLGIRRQIVYLAKKELFTVPVLNWWIRSLGAYPVARKKGDVKAVKTLIRLLRQGKAILIFPEGTRSFDGEIQDFESGLAWLSIKTSVSVVPVYLDGTYRSLPRGGWFPWPFKIWMNIGQPINPVASGFAETDPKTISAFNERIKLEMLNLKKVLEQVKQGAKKPDHSPAENLNTN